MIWLARRWPAFSRLYWFLRATRPAYCERCGVWSWSRNHSIAYSTCTAWLCEPCGVEEDLEVAAAWAEYYAGCM